MALAEDNFSSKAWLASRFAISKLAISSLLAFSKESNSSLCFISREASFSSIDSSNISFSSSRALYLSSTFEISSSRDLWCLSESSAHLFFSFSRSFDHSV
eukprot:TRINITY_DN6020_c0_g1_i1.p1 TRINITY_DN6020_c0_g1~~TRINITY_DN6020_c0_g1_i1.p1  ORF type:complete len:101 (-),score=7.06 TRINITY_DN6020_c0_g1_i1:117-419(-)